METYNNRFNVVVLRTFTSHYRRIEIMRQTKMRLDEARTQNDSKKELVSFDNLLACLV